MKPPIDWTYFVGDDLNDEGDVAGYTSAAEALRNAAESDRWLAEHDRQVQAEALRKFRQEVIDDQIETYGIVLPDVDGIIDRLNEAADEIEKGQTDGH